MRQEILGLLSKVMADHRARSSSLVEELGEIHRELLISSSTSFPLLVISLPRRNDR
jgi:hypothetical protein